MHNSLQVLQALSNGDLETAIRRNANDRFRLQTMSSTVALNTEVSPRLSDLALDFGIGRNSSLSVDDFRSALQSSTVGGFAQEDLDDLICLLDFEGRGKISLSNFRVVMQSIADPRTTEQLQELGFAGFDESMSLDGSVDVVTLSNDFSIGMRGSLHSARF